MLYHYEVGHVLLHVMRHRFKGQTTFGRKTVTGSVATNTAEGALEATAEDKRSSRKSMAYDAKPRVLRGKANGDKRRVSDFLSKTLMRRKPQSKGMCCYNFRKAPIHSATVRMSLTPTDCFRLGKKLRN